MRDAPSLPDFTLEQALMARGLGAVAGVDEVGRGPLAGPVSAAAVVLDPACIPPGLNDSKKLSASARLRLAQAIRQGARWAVAHASVQEIDALNILQASHLAMRRALAALDPPADFALIDGNRLPRDLALPAQAVVKGDARCLSIAAASILAKVARDAIMADLAREWPGYGWQTNAGYPSAGHLAALQTLGVTPHHRRSFAPVRKMLCEEN
ncbi:MAG: ribonuclease HII [Pararhodobacter sp.]